MRGYLYVDVKNVHSKKMLPSFSILYHNVMLLCVYAHAHNISVMSCPFIIWIAIVKFFRVMR